MNLNNASQVLPFLKGVSELLQISTVKHFTGRLELNAGDDYRWDVFFRLGRIVWVCGGVHRVRRWERMCQRFNLELPIESMRLDRQECQGAWMYHALCVALAHQYASREQVQAAITDAALEAMFDLIQVAETSTVSGIAYADEALAQSVVLLRADDLLRQALRQWQAWQQTGLGNFSPNASPLIVSEQKLRSLVSDRAANRLLKIATGQKSLRDLAVMLDQDLLRLSRSLAGGVSQGALSFIAIEDLPLPEFVRSSLKHPLDDESLLDSPPRSQPPEIECATGLETLSILSHPGLTTASPQSRLQQVGMVPSSPLSSPPNSLESSSLSIEAWSGTLAPTTKPPVAHPHHLANPGDRITPEGRSSLLPPDDNFSARELAIYPSIKSAQLNDELIVPSQRTSPTIPTAPPLPQSPQKQPHPSLPTQPPLIFHVDDSPQNCLIAQVLLENIGFRYQSLNDPLLALPQMLQARPNLIILDLMMPVVNGHELCAQIRRTSALQELPIVMLTSQDGLIDRVRSKMVNASAFISKPINPDVFLKTIRRFVDVTATQTINSMH